MARFLQERQVQQGYQDERVATEVQRAQVAAAQETPKTRTQVSRRRTMTDVEMESVGTCEYDPDDMVVWRDRLRGLRLLQRDRCPV